MKLIPIEKVKRDNSNITYFDRSLWKELRKERFKKPQHEKYIAYCIVADKLSFNPYNDLNVALDIEDFKNGLDGLERDCFEYFLQGMIHEEISIMVGRGRSRVTQILLEVVKKFDDYYRWDDSE